jgi:uncharacterized membrane protein
MVLATALEIFTKVGGAFASRWLHVIVGITWIGLLYYFNFVQVPAFAELDADARNKAMDKITWRALWWFRWSALATLITGVAILAAQTDQVGDKQQLWSGDYFKSAPGMSILTGVLLAVTMFANVWLIIWPKQQVVIGNARNVLAGGQADPAAPDAARRGALASRMNTIFSIPMLLFMVGTSHFFLSSHFLQEPSGGRRVVYWIVTIVVWLILELNALGVIAGTAQTWTKKIYETHLNAIITGLVLAIGWYALWEIVLRA